MINCDGLILVNFGGPRDLNEVDAFLKSLLCDKDVIRSGLPQPLHNILFKRIATKRAQIVREDYEQIGGGSPIFFDTERLGSYLRQEFQLPVFVFHRYLTATHGEFFDQLESFSGCNLIVFPLFPQFSYATTGSCARFFKQYLSKTVLEKLLWVPSYEAHPAFISAYAANMQAVLKSNTLDEDKVCFIYSCHGLPQKFILEGDPYQKHCQRSFESLKRFFPQADHVLSYQSKFGKGQWLEPSTSSLVEEGVFSKNHLIFVPLSFTSDHIETLFEIQQLYMEPLKKQGKSVFRTQAIATDFGWIKQILMSSYNLVPGEMLVFS